MSHLHFDVRCYDEHHGQALRSIEFFRPLDNLVQKGLDVGRDEYMTYMLFREQRPYTPGWHTYADLRARLPSRYQQIIDNYDLSGGTVRSVFAGSGSLDVSMVEGAGVAAGLVLANALFGLHAADWEKIPITNHRALDFQLASDGSRYVQVECKGSVVQDGTISPSISKHKSDIESKKQSVRATATRDVLLGVISAFPTVGNMDAILRLVDPEAVAIDMPPKKFKLLSRLTYYGRLSRSVSDSRFVAALRNRIRAITVLDEWDRLSGVALQKNSGDPYHLDAAALAASTFIDSVGAVGRLYVVGGKMLFDGVKLQCLNLVAGQRFPDICGYRAEPETEAATFDGFLPREAAQELELTDDAWQPVRGTQSIRVRVRALAHVQASGRVFGWGEVAK